MGADPLARSPVSCWGPETCLQGVIRADAPANGMVRFWTRDNGQGLSEQERATLFQRFSRLDRHQRIEGYGLGLSIVQRIVGKLGGEVGIESEVGVGSTFYFCLPTGT